MKFIIKDIRYHYNEEYQIFFISEKNIHSSWCVPPPPPPFQHTTTQITELFDPRGTAGGECATFRAVLPEWCCLDHAHLVQDQEAKSQEG